MTTCLLTRYDAGEGNAGDSLECETIQIISCHSKEEGLVGWNELCNVPEAKWLALRIVADWQSFDHLARD